MSKKNFFLILSFLIIPGIGLLDQVSGDDLSLIVLYLIPIVLASWQAGPRWGAGIGVLALASWVIANIALPIHVDLDPGFQRSWDLAEKILFFAAAIFATARLRVLVSAEKAKGLTDFATGLPNRRAFVAELSAHSGKESLDVGFIEFEGLENLYLEQGEAFVEALLKSAATIASAIAPTYRFGDERLAFILAAGSDSAAEERTDRLAERLDRELLGPKAPTLRLKIGIARCRTSVGLSYPALRKFLEGSMIYLRGRPGPQVQRFDFAKA
jgi:GGDEF domain-containing protein